MLAPYDANMAMVPRDVLKDYRRLARLEETIPGLTIRHANEEKH